MSKLDLKKRLEKLEKADLEKKEQIDLIINSINQIRRILFTDGFVQDSVRKMNDTDIRLFKIYQALKSLNDFLEEKFGYKSNLLDKD